MCRSLWVLTPSPRPERRSLILLWVSYNLYIIITLYGSEGIYSRTIGQVNSRFIDFG